jgi:hypothetical protein
MIVLGYLMVTVCALAVLWGVCLEVKQIREDIKR